MAASGQSPRLAGDVSTVAPHPSASFSATLRVHLDNQPGAFAALAGAIGEAGGLLGSIDLVRVERGKKVRDVVVLAADDKHIAKIVEAVRALAGIEVEHVSDRTFLLHLGGKLEVVAEDTAEDPRGPLDGLYARRRARLQRDRGRPREGLEPDRQAAHASPSSPTAPRCSVWGTSAPRQHCP